MNSSNVKELHNNNFTIGSHGYNHFWWGQTSKNKQEEELKKFRVLIQIFILFNIRIVKE